MDKTQIIVAAENLISDPATSKDVKQVARAVIARWKGGKISKAAAAAASRIRKDSSSSKDARRIAASALILPPAVMPSPERAKLIREAVNSFFSVNKT